MPQCFRVRTLRSLAHFLRPGFISISLLSIPCGLTAAHANPLFGILSSGSAGDASSGQRWNTNVFENVLAYSSPVLSYSDSYQSVGATVSDNATAWFSADGNGGLHVLEMNCAAEQILAENDGLMAEKGVLAASTANATKEIGSKVTAAALTARGTGISAGGLIRIERSSGKRPFSLVVMPLSRLAFSPDGREPAVMVFVTDPETKSRTAPEALAHAYHLTPAESRLAEQLMHGETLMRAAERLGVSHNTARTHLQKIYQKTNTSHQGELVRVLVSLASVTDPQP